MGWVDVRDVAEAHVAAMHQSDGRHLVCGQTLSLLEVSRALGEAFPDLRWPRRALPKWLAWALVRC